MSLRKLGTACAAVVVLSAVPLAAQAVPVDTATVVTKEEAATAAPADSVFGDQGIEEGKEKLRSQAITYNRKLISKSKTTNWTDYGQRLTSCKGASGGITCSLSKTYTVSRTVGVDLGISRKNVTAALKISNSTSQSVTVNCSITVKKGETLALYPRGDHHKYKIQRETVSTAGTVIKTDVSGWKYAFNPGAADYTCIVEK